MSFPTRIAAIVVQSTGSRRRLADPCHTICRRPSPQQKRDLAEQTVPCSSPRFSGRLSEQWVPCCSISEQARLKSPLTELQSPSRLAFLLQPPGSERAAWIIKGLLGVEMHKPSPSQVSVSGTTPPSLPPTHATATSREAWTNPSRAG